MLGKGFCNPSASGKDAESEGKVFETDVDIRCGTFIRADGDPLFFGYDLQGRAAGRAGKTDDGARVDSVEIISDARIMAVQDSETVIEKFQDHGTDDMLGSLFRRACGSYYGWGFI